jgi:hypothetical protein
VVAMPEISGDALHPFEMPGEQPPVEFLASVLPPVWNVIKSALKFLIAIFKSYRHATHSSVCALLHNREFSLTD